MSSSSSCPSAPCRSAADQCSASRAPLADALNRDCTCITLDHRALEQTLGQGGIDGEILRSRPHLFSDSVVFVSRSHLERMAELVSIVDQIVSHPAWQERVLGWAPAAARQTTAAAGVFLGYDFHVGSNGPQLIEINTNAGGGLLNSHLAAAQRQSCMGLVSQQDSADATFCAMFREEWRRARGDAPLRSIAIVDQNPAAQYLAPEFELFRQLFIQHGIDAQIADPTELSWDGSRLSRRGKPIDLIYNRLVDFSFSAPENAPLLAAWQADGAVITPHPRSHALYADKRNLIALCDDAWLGELGVSAADRRLIASMVPMTRLVEADAAAAFWAERKRWFFKPSGGYGSRAAYRGDKITKRVFEEIIQGGYIAQSFIAPSERWLNVAGKRQAFKLDLRNYAYAGKVQLVAARLYQGQTTNFRTPGGGFAPVFEVAPELPAA